MSRFLTFPAGRIAKYVILAACLLVLFASGAANLPGKYTDAENNESTTFLPGDAESTKVLAITEELQGGEQAPVVIVFRRGSPPTARSSTGRSRRTGTTSTERSRRSPSRSSRSPATPRC